MTIPLARATWANRRIAPWNRRSIKSKRKLRLLQNQAKGQLPWVSYTCGCDNTTSTFCIPPQGRNHLPKPSQCFIISTRKQIIAPNLLKARSYRSYLQTFSPLVEHLQIATCTKGTSGALETEDNHRRNHVNREPSEKDSNEEKMNQTPHTPWKWPVGNRHPSPTSPRTEPEEKPATIDFAMFLSP